MILSRTVAAVGSIGVVSVLALCGCGSDSRSGVEVSRHAKTAGIVMTQDRGPLPARAAADRVTGEVDNTIIEAMTVRGTTWGGSVTLRISVNTGRSSNSLDHTTRCYRYRFHYPRTQDDGEPHQTDCPSTPALDVATPPLPTGVDNATLAKARRVLDRLDATARDNPRAIRAALIAAIGPDYTVTVSREHPHYVWIRYGDQCLTAQVSPDAVHLDPPRHGDACFGG